VNTEFQRANLRKPVAQVQRPQNIGKTPVFGQGAHVFGAQEFFSIDGHCGRPVNCDKIISGSRRIAMELSGVISNGTVVFDQPCLVPDGTKVTIRIEGAAEAKPATASSTVGKRLLKHAGTVTGLPEDMAEQHDHYLHGTPKR
jgi:hypothetical protein